MDSCYPAVTCILAMLICSVCLILWVFPFFFLSGFATKQVGDKPDNWSTTRRIIFLWSPSVVGLFPTIIREMDMSAWAINTSSSHHGAMSCWTEKFYVKRKKDLFRSMYLWPIFRNSSALLGDRVSLRMVVPRDPWCIRQAIQRAPTHRQLANSCGKSSVKSGSFRPKMQSRAKKGFGSGSKWMSRRGKRVDSCQSLMAG